MFCVYAGDVKWTESFYVMLQTGMKRVEIYSSNVDMVIINVPGLFATSPWFMQQ
jgi:hypothetical protein